MKKLLVLLYLFIVLTPSNADQLDEVLTNLSEEVSGLAGKLIPGEGYTEISINLRENGYSPDFSILGVREVAPIQDGKVFTQFSLFNTEAGTQGGDDRIIGNFGLGVRKLTQDNTLMIGVNNFYDYSVYEEHARTSLGIEARAAVLELTANRYIRLGDRYNSETVLDGWDYGLASQIPHLHWAKAFVNGYEWEGVKRTDVRGIKYGSEMTLTPHLSFELAFDDKDRKALQDEWYSKINFIHPGVEGPSALDGISDVAWKENRDMTSELLSKVKRSNKIFVEFKATSTISRTD